MDRRKIIIFVLLASLSLSLVVNIPLMDALEVGTHELINEMISFNNFNNFSLNTYLIDHLGINEGVNELFNGNAVSRWIRKGGLYEDEPWNPPFDFTLPYLRSVNHFHNPLTEKGFSGFLFGVSLSGDSSVKWAQKPIHTQSPGGHYSWYDARDYFYKALITRDKTFREKFFAETFRALGQLMHLLQDASVPEHTRDDFHVAGFEIWVKENVNMNAITPFRFDKSILNRLTSELPIVNLFDTNQYDGTSPDGTAGTNMGLTEYSNANFFSGDTINSKKFRYPSTDLTTIVERPYVTKFGDPYTRQYYLKNCCGETKEGLGYLLSAVDSLDYWRKRDPRLSNMAKIPILDGSVYNDYASLLLPRAVSYSAGLLEYFFRGNLQVTSLPIFYKNGICIMRVKIKNLTPSKETMKNGWFTLTYRYTPTGKPSDGSKDVFGQALFKLNPDDPLAPCPEVKYEKDEISIDFVLPDLIPRENYDSAKFMLAFKGTLGNEEGAVIGRFFTPGEIKFDEEWNKGLTGNHTWAHTDFDTSKLYPGHGETSNTVEGDTLIKENIRYTGYKNPSVNSSFVGNNIIDPKYNDKLPILITSNTSLQFKIDNMSINLVPPSLPGTTTHYQGLWLIFNHGLVIQLSTDQFVYYTPQTADCSFDLGKIVVSNIHNMFQEAGITIPPGDLYLEGIEFVQQLFELGDDSTVLHRQRMEVDFIRLIEEKLQEEKP
jgi:hypothetical protein